MKYYVYFDAYGHARQVVSEKEMAENYRNEPDRFLKAMCRLQPDTNEGHVSGHVGTLSFDNDEELKDYLESLGDEIAGFYKADSDSRPYNF
ncbi:MAG: hypothetical protein PVI82_05410 [Desulfobacterales bacterium]|jgi:hypothetical protein